MLRRISEEDWSVVLVSAPAGYGKTTLLAQWATRHTGDDAPAWLQLHPRDDDVHWLITEILVSLAAEPQEATDPSTDPFGPDLGRDWLPRVLRCLDDRPLSPATLVLSEVDALQSRAATDVIASLLRGHGDRLRLVLETRDVPPWLRRALPARDVLELGPSDLAFDARETASALRRVLGQDVDERVADAVREATEGWPAMVAMAGSAIRLRPDQELFRDPRAPAAWVEDYLVSEILERQPEPVREFLVRTAVLEEMSGSLCRAVLEDEDAPARLEELAASSPLVSAATAPDGHTDTWYRYNRVLREALDRRLRRSDPDLAVELARRAGRWYAQQDHVFDAVRVLIRADDVEAAKALVLARWERYVMAGFAPAILAWLGLFDHRRVSEDPELALVAAWASAGIGRLGEASRHARTAEQSPPGARLSSFPTLHDGVMLLRATFGWEGFAAMAAAAERAAQHVSGRWEALAQYDVGLVRLYSGRPGEAQAAFERAIAVMPDDFELLHMSALAMLAVAQSETGDVDRALSNAWEAQRVLEDTRLGRTPQAGMALMALGTAFVGVGRIPEGRMLCDEAMDRIRAAGSLSTWMTMVMLGLLTSARVADGDRVGALNALDELRDLVAANPDAGALPDRLERLETALGVAGRDHTGAGLTERELDVLRLMKGPLPMSAIARELGMATNTVKSHRRSIYAKLGVGSRDDALLRAEDLGLLARLPRS